MKRLKWILSVLFILILFAGSWIGSFLFFQKGTYDFDTAYLTVLDDDANSYYLQKAPDNLKFRVVTDSPETPLNYMAADSQGNAVSLKAEKVSGNEYNILAPAEGYTAGERYTLTLGDGVSFTDENLSSARELMFSVERDPIAQYTFTDQVVEISEPIVALSEDRISVEGLDVQPGEILFGTDENNEYVVYKITQLMDDGTAVVAVPAIDEIYQDLQVYGEYVFDVNEIAANPDLKIEIIENVRQSDFFSALMLAAYAEEPHEDAEFNVSVTPDSATNSLGINITITLKPGENGLFGISALRDHTVSLKLKTTLNLKTYANIQGVKDWDVSGTLTSDFSWEVEISRIAAKAGGNKALQELFQEKEEYSSYDEYYLRKQYQEHVKPITEALNQIAADVSGGEIKLFDWKLPVPSVPGLYFTAQINWVGKFSMTASVLVGQESSTVYTVGVCFANGDFRTYSNTYKTNGDFSMSLRGKASVKGGIGLVVKATLITDSVANIRLIPQAGLYADVYVVVPFLGGVETIADDFAYGYFEGGAYFSADVEASLNVLVKRFKFNYQLIEKKYPIITLGNDKIVTGFSMNATNLRAVNYTVNLPEFLLEYVNVKTGLDGLEPIPLDEIQFVSSEGEDLEVEDGILTLPETTPSGSCYVTATYRDENDMTYSNLFRVLVSGSVLEGKVSAYTDDSSDASSAIDIEGAQVELYAEGNASTPIATQYTDANGGFSFNVSEGTYTLVIHADGYQTLTSTQQVGEDEVKYTEHILLIDNSQSGLGSAGGTITNALDGRGISSVRLRLRRDWNNKTGPYVDEIGTTTNNSGYYSISEMPVGYYTVEASLNGYVTGYSNIIVLNENPKTDFDFTITPILSDDEVRIVLTWGDSPRDLDSHLVGRTPSDGTFNVYYGDKEYDYDGVEMANLDTDDTSSYGPETITITERIYGTYTYAVHNYSNRNNSSSDALSFSGAVVRVFMGSAQVAEYHVPTDQVGTYWTVFQIDSAERITPINTVSNTKPAA